MALIKPWLQFKFGAGENYTPAALSRVTDSDIEAEYTRLRKAALGRLKTIGKSEFKKSDVYIQNKDRYNLTAKQILREGGASLLKYRLASIYRFLSRQTSSVTGLREQAHGVLKTLHEHGYTFVNTDNLQEFGRFMEDTRVAAEAMRYDSERVAELYDASKKDNVPVDVLIKYFELFMEK